jgi:hypothetical protein
MGLLAFKMHAGIPCSQEGCDVPLLSLTDVISFQNGNTCSQFTLLQVATPSPFLIRGPCLRERSTSVSDYTKVLRVKTLKLHKLRAMH